jgi:hypothetical protein
VADSTRIHQLGRTPPLPGPADSRVSYTNVNRTGLASGTPGAHQSNITANYILQGATPNKDQQLDFSCSEHVAKGIVEQVIHIRGSGDGYIIVFDAVTPS